MSKTHQLKTQELIDLVAANGWQGKFQKAFEKAKSYDVQEMDDINSLDDYFDWLDANLTWIGFRSKTSSAAPCSTISVNSTSSSTSRLSRNCRLLSSPTTFRNPSPRCQPRPTRLTRPTGPTRRPLPHPLRRRDFLLKNYLAGFIAETALNSLL